MSSYRKILKSKYFQQIQLHCNLKVKITVACVHLKDHANVEKLVVVVDAEAVHQDLQTNVQALVIATLVL